MRASFGLMDARCALLIRVEDAEGAHGWGEVWCNWPTFGAEHRAMTVERTLAPIAFEKPLAPADLFAALTRRTAVLAIQTAEHGPIAQAIGGFDMAVWDCAARRAGLPLAAALGATQSSVKVYASGIDPREMDALIPAARAAGHRRFKLKVGFGRERDLETVRALVGSMGPNERFMLDANQAWAEDDARAMAAALAERADPLWLEEPLRADAPLEAWRAVAARGVRLAGGENLVGRPAFDAAIAGGALGVIQPDAGKWGGITGCLAVARATGAAGRLYCPHHLGGAVGLMAAAHLTAAGGDPASILEMDVNANPLRRDMARTPPVVSGRMVLPEDAGLGIEPDLATLAPLIARRGEARA
jgi:L-alanine-DL-glutamate epimerase-like enolase superfamily enzyme